MLASPRPLPSQHDPTTTVLTGDPVRAVYQAIDDGLGEILTQVDDDTVVIFLASHRMSHNFGAQFLLPEILLRLKACEPSASQETASSALNTPDMVEAFLNRGWQCVPRGIREKLRPVRDHLRAHLEDRKPIRPSSLSGIDPAKSKCFPLDNGLSTGGIRLNLAGREPQGVIERGASMEQFCRELIGDLMDIVDAESGRPAISKIMKTAELYRGEGVPHLPDLLVQWSDERPVGNSACENPAGSTLRLTSKKIGIVEGVNRYCRTGDHRAEGLFIASGGGVEAGSLERTVSVTDFAPTFAALLGVKLAEMDGEPIAEIVEGAQRP